MGHEGNDEGCRLPVRKPDQGYLLPGKGAGA